MDIAEELEKLNELRKSGALSEQEFTKAKATLLASKQPPSSPVQSLKQTLEENRSNANMWGMAIHLSQFCGYLVPLAGLIVPILIWQTKKNDSPIIDRHGRIVANWMMTVIPLAAIFFVLTLAIIGLPLLIVLGVIVIIFPVVGAIKAQSGEAWKYPGSIPFFRVSDPE